MIGFLGGTGPEGRGLALRLALAGEDVIIGSRDGSRAAAAAEEVAGLAPGAVVEGALNEETAARADVVFIAVPYSAQRPTISFGLPIEPEDSQYGKSRLRTSRGRSYERGLSLSATRLTADLRGRRFRERPRCQVDPGCTRLYRRRHHCRLDSMGALSFHSSHRWSGRHHHLLDEKLATQLFYEVIRYISPLTRYSPYWESSVRKTPLG